MRYLILGNGAAGFVAAEKLREICTEDEITIISKERVPAYSKPMLPDYVGGKLSKDKIIVRDFEHYKSKRINLVTCETVKSIDTKNKVVVSEKGFIANYDKLLVAIGAVSFVPEIEGLEKVEYFTLNSVADADKLKESSVPGGKAVILGGGLNGIETSFALKAHGMDVTILERGEQLLPRQLDSKASDVMREEILSHGINLILNGAVEKIECDEASKKSVRLSDGQKLDFDILVISIGTRSNIKAVDESDIKCDRGILVDEYLKTSVEDVFAAGDVAQIKSKIGDGYVSSYIWPNAMAQGKCAALNMAGQVQEFEANVIKQSVVQLRDFPFITMGMSNSSDSDIETLTEYIEDKRIYKKVVIKDNKAVGMIFIGDTKNAQYVSGLIRKGADISEIKHTLLNRD